MTQMEVIEKLVLKAFPGARVKVSDMTGTGDHFEIEIASEKFRGKPLLEQHRLVFAVLEQEMQRGLHAVKLKTRAL